MGYQRIDEKPKELEGKEPGGNPPEANPQPGAPEDSMVRGSISEALASGRYFLTLSWIDESKPVQQRRQNRRLWINFPFDDVRKVGQEIVDMINAETEKRQAMGPLSGPNTPEASLSPVPQTQKQSAPGASPPPGY